MQYKLNIIKSESLKEIKECKFLQIQNNFKCGFQLLEHMTKMLKNKFMIYSFHKMDPIYKYRKLCEILQKCE